MPDYQHEMIEETSGLPVKFMLSQNNSLTIPAHWHEYLEVLYMLEGELTAVIQANTYRLSPGELMVINSKELHMTRAEGPVSYIMIQMSQEQLLRLLPGKRHLHFKTMVTVSDNPSVYPVLEEHLLHMLDIFQKQHDGYQLLFSADLYGFLYHLYQNYANNSPITEEAGGIRDLQRVTAVMDWVRSDYSQALSLEDAAASLAVSREYFCRLFKKYTGQTFLEYLNSVRTMHLYEDLKKSDENITVLMEKNGITNYKVFMRTFKKLYGDTPQHIRSSLI